MPALSLLSRGTGDVPSVSAYLSVQWDNPSDILSVLLLLGPDIIQRAVAQLAGRAITPVAFSFGWASYAVNALLSSIGDMPDTDVPNTLVISASSGRIQSTKSWVLGRLLRDLDNSIADEIQEEEVHVRGGFRLAVFEVEENPNPDHGVPKLDLIWYLGVIVIAIQLAIATIPWALNGHWDIFLVTAAGTSLALFGASLPHWREGKWACPRRSGGTVTITQGNGSRTGAIILANKGVGLDLEVLARMTRSVAASGFTRTATAVLALLWIVFLITVAGMKQDTWYLLGVGVLGSIQNVIAACAPRKPESHGLHIKRMDTIRAKRVAKVLQEAETRYPGVGTSLLDVFFPGSLRVKDPEDIAFWKGAMEARKKKQDRFGTRVDCL